VLGGPYGPLAHPRSQCSWVLGSGIATTPDWPGMDGACFSLALNAKVQMLKKEALKR
jgi:hypothetical protein